MLAADLSGGNLTAAFQLLLTTLVKHGKHQIRNPWSTLAPPFTIPNPPSAGLSMALPWLEITRSMPPCQKNEH